MTFKRRLIRFLWKVYQLINIKDSRVIKKETLAKINRTQKLRMATIGALKDNDIKYIYNAGLEAVDKKATTLAYMLLNNCVDKDLIRRVATHGFDALVGVEKMFTKLKTNERYGGFDDKIIKATTLPKELFYLGGYTSDFVKLSERSKDLYTRRDFLQNIYLTLEEEKNYINSNDKNVIGDTNEFCDIVLDDVMRWDAEDYLNSLGTVNCRKVNTLTISRPPRADDSEILDEILDLYSKIAVTLRDMLYTLDSTNNIIKLIASKFYNDEYLYVTRTLERIP